MRRRECLRKGMIKKKLCEDEKTVRRKGGSERDTIVLLSLCDHRKERDGCSANGRDWLHF